MVYVKPAYGRQYWTQEEVLADWNSGKDFRIHEGTYINKTEYDKYLKGEGLCYLWHTAGGPFQFEMEKVFYEEW
jgi:hypothetical protein